MAFNFLEREKRMKKIISLFITVCILFASLSLPVLALDQENEDTNEDISVNDGIFNNALTYTCIYDIQKKRVTLSGSLNKEIFSDYGGWSLCVYAVPFGATEYDVVTKSDSKPLAQALISINFQFSFKADQIEYRYSRYAIFLRSPQGEMILAAKAQYPEVNSTFELPEGIRNYKGISTEFSSFVTDVDAGTLILPVHLDELFSQNSSSTFVLADGKQYFFNKSTVDKLDMAINSTTVSGTKVYLRLLYKDLELDVASEYSIPRLEQVDELVKLHCAVSFLAGRYSANEKAKITGFVLGNAWNNENEFLKVDSFDRYVMLCGDYAVVVANAARTVNSALDVVIPFDGDGFVKADETNHKINSKKLIESIFEYLDTAFHKGLDCSLIISSQNTPFGIRELTPESVIDVKTQSSTGKFCAGEQKAFSSYIDLLSHRYDSCPERYIFEWIPSRVLKDNALATAYAYSYYSLLMDHTVRAFVVNVSSDDTNLRNIKHLVKFMDAHEGSDVAKELAGFFGKKLWSEVLETNSSVNSSVNHYFVVEPRLNSSERFVGEFKYFDPEDISLTQNWSFGNQCTDIKTEYTQEGEKALKADLLLSGTQDYSEILYVFEYSENMIHTQDLKLKFNLSDTLEDAVYELKLVLGNSKNKLESSCIVKGNSINEMLVDISKCATANTIDFIKISVRSLDGRSEACSLYLHEICGLSNEYTSDELNALIHAEREKIKDLDEEASSAKISAQWFLAIGVVLVTGVLGVAIFIGFIREDKPSDEKDDISDN